MKRSSPIARISGFLALFAMVATVSGVTRGMVVCLGPDGHVAVEFAHHEDHGPVPSGRDSRDEHAYDSSADPSCTDILLFVIGSEITRSARLSHQALLDGVVSESPVRGPSGGGPLNSFSRLEAGGAFQPPLHSLRSIVLLI